MLLRYMTWGMLLGTSFFVSACTYETQPPSAPTGRVTMGMVGAVGGAMVASPVLAGALIGATSGSVLGDHYDKGNTLIRQIQNSGVQIFQVGENVTLVLPADQFFQPRSPIMRSYSYATLDKIAEFLRQDSRVTIKVAGYTDDEDVAERNLSLSRQWAENIAKYLLEHDVDARLLYAVGYGHCSSVADNKTKESRGMNRRIEISFHTIES